MAVDATVRRLRSHVSLLVMGAIAIVTGGMTAAVTGPTEWSHGSWVSAFLVLVAGVAQVGIALSQVGLDAVKASARFASMECALWNCGCTAIVAGTLLSNPTIVLAGSVPLTATLAMSTHVVRQAIGPPPLFLALHRMMTTILLVSIPVGVVLAWIRR